MKPILADYFPKRTSVPADWTTASVTELCSVSRCLAPAPEDWVEHWRHNDMGFYNTRRNALSVLPPGAADFSLFAYSVLPVRYSKDRTEPFEIVGEGVEPLPAGFISLGFDVANKTLTPFF